MITAHGEEILNTIKKLILLKMICFAKLRSLHMQLYYTDYQTSDNIDDSNYNTGCCITFYEL